MCKYMTIPTRGTQTFQREGAAREVGHGGSPGYKMGALHRTLYKVSFHLGGAEGGTGFLTEGAQTPQHPCVPWLRLGSTPGGSTQGW